MLGIIVLLENKPSSKLQVSHLNSFSFFNFKLNEYKPPLVDKMHLNSWKSSLNHNIQPQKKLNIVWLMDKKAIPVFWNTKFFLFFLDESFSPDNHKIQFTVHYPTNTKNLIQSMFWNYGALFNNTFNQMTSNLFQWMWN